MGSRTIHVNGIAMGEVHRGIWRIEPRDKMRVAVHLVGSEEIIRAVGDDKSIQQAMNVATLPGVLEPVLAMPDIHQGYGFPIGGVAAFHPKSGVVSPGGVGYDINCGVRLLKTDLDIDEVRAAGGVDRLIDDLFEAVPSGVGSKRSDLRLSGDDFEGILREGARYAVSKGFGHKGDLDLIEEGGRLPGADPAAVSSRARERGALQLGTLGSGNHFIEVQYVDLVADEAVAKAFGLELNQIVISIHTGSRGLGYQVCSDYLDSSIEACRKYGIALVDRELAAAPLDSPEGQGYLKAMSSAANFAFANRQIIGHWVRQAVSTHFPKAGEMEVLYDVCHNIAKFEDVGSTKSPISACVHRKGATRAYPPRHAKIPGRYRDTGQPVIVPGDMGRYSYVLAGRPEALERTFGSACHGAGRELSRSAAKKRAKGRALERELRERGVVIRAAGRDTVVEEMPEAYKDVSKVVEAAQEAGIADIVCRLRPVGVVKG